jgi:hypothetical protein
MDLGYIEARSACGDHRACARINFHQSSPFAAEDIENYQSLTPIRATTFYWLV